MRERDDLEQAVASGYAMAHSRTYASRRLSERRAREAETVEPMSFGELWAWAGQQEQGTKAN